MLDMTKILTDLSAKRPIFHSEADFQHALAWEIHQQRPEYSMRLERKLSNSSNRNMHLDIWAFNVDTLIAIELKYKTKKFDADDQGESFSLADHSAPDTGRYDFLKDIQRLEWIAYKHPNTIGYAIFLSNDKTYWVPSSNQSTNDAQFRIHQGRSLTGTLSWGINAAKGTMKERESPIILQGLYQANWQDYSRLSGLPQMNGDLKYLLCEVHSPNI